MNWTRRSFLASLPAGAALARGARPAAPPAHPNVVLIAVEDLGAWMLSCYGNLEIKTPGMDKLAGTGMRFINHFTVTPVAGASRATVLSGRIPRQHGLADYFTPEPQTNPTRGQAAMPASFSSEVLVSDVLAGAGYHCGYMGVWALGQDEHPGHGYNETATLVGDAMLVNGQRQPITDSSYEAITRHALGYLDRQPASGPFFLTVSYPGLASVFATLPARCSKLYESTTFSSFGIQPVAAAALEGREQMARVQDWLKLAAAAVSLLDEQVAALQKRVIERGVFENTIVVLVGLQGHLLGRHGLWGSGYASNPPNFYEETMHTPLLVSWPGRIPVEAIRPEMISTVDIVPTLCDAAGATAPARGLPGRSFFPLALNRPLPRRQPWRNLVFGQLRDSEMARDTRFKLVTRGEGEGGDTLYDLRNDSNERINQIENPEFSDVRTRLAGELRAWHEKYAS
jgi:arylsulfatase